MRRFRHWAGLTVLVAVFCLWRYSNVAQGPLFGERPSPPNEQAAVEGPSTGAHFADPTKVPPQIIPLPSRPPAIVPLSPAIAPPKQASFEAIANAKHNGKVLFQLAENPHIYVLDYESLHMQGRALNRVAAFIEWQEAPKKQVLDDQALAEMIKRTSENPDTLFFGHDYRAADLVRFFTTAQHAGIQLNAEELALQALLLGQRFLQADQDGFILIPPEKVLVSITQEQGDIPQTSRVESITMLMRRTILSHELSHGEFFTHPAYARYCENFWRYSLSASQRGAFTRFLSSAQHYNAGNENLLINEFQAYLAYSGVNGYFFGYDVVAGISAAEMARLREQFIADSPAHFRPLQESLEEVTERQRAPRLH